ncbi:MAG: hypothetical protein WCB12_20735 [Bryobacteraceae bacterium]
MVRYGCMQEQRGAPRREPKASIRAFAICAFALYAAVTLTVMVRVIVRESSFEQLEPNETTDSFLQVLDAPQPGLLVKDGLRRYGPHQRLLFVGPARESSTLRVYFTIAYLAYPRPVAAIFCGEAGESRAFTMEKAPRSAEIAGLIFFDTGPGRWAVGGTQVTSKLYMAPNNGAASWESCCR